MIFKILLLCTYETISFLFLFRPPITQIIQKLVCMTKNSKDLFLINI